VGGCARQSRKYPCPVRRPKTAEESLWGRVVYASSNRRQKGAAYVFGLGFLSNQGVQSEVCCSRTRWRIQERVTGEGVEGSVEAACLVSASALSLPGMAVCLGTQWTMMVESVLLMSVAISWMSRAVSCRGVGSGVLPRLSLPGCP
jgi:hypothetical protein